MKQKIAPIGKITRKLVKYWQDLHIRREETEDFSGCSAAWSKYSSEV